MIRNSKILVDNTTNNGIKNTCTTSRKPLDEPQLPSKLYEALEIIDTDVHPFDVDNIESIQLRQIYSQQARLRELIEQKAKMMSPNQVKRLQACIQRIAVIGYDIPNRKGKPSKDRLCKL